MSGNNILLQKVVPALLEQAKTLLLPDSLFVALENVKQAVSPTEGDLLVSMQGATYTAKPVQVDSFETSKLLILHDDREEVSLPMDILQKIFGEGAKLQAFAVDNSKVIVIMVDKNYDEVTSYPALMESIAAVLAEMCDMESGRIGHIEKIRMPMTISGGFTLAARHEDNGIRIDFYNDDLVHTGSIDGLHLIF